MHMGHEDAATGFKNDQQKSSLLLSDDKNSTKIDQKESTVDVSGSKDSSAVDSLLIQKIIPEDSKDSEIKPDINNAILIETKKEESKEPQDVEKSTQISQKLQ